MDARPHLATLLSQVLVAYTIEADYEFESSMPHRTALSRAAGEKPRGPWLISLAMWANFLSLVPEQGISVKELSLRSGIRKVDTAGMERWGYVRLEDGMLRRTPGGDKAARVWSPIEERIEQRWRERFGSDVVSSLRAAVDDSLADVEQVGPNYLPIVRYGLWSTEQLRPDRSPDEQGDSLSAVLCRALTVIAVAFERTSPVSIALAANTLRILGPAGTPVREVSRRAGIAKEVTEVALGFLDKQGLVRIANDKGGKVVTPTGAGLATQKLSDERLAELDGRFEIVRGPLEAILSNTDAMVDTLTPHPESWRARSPYAAQTERILADPRGALPHFPVVTHRGGYPDGS